MPVLTYDIDTQRKDYDVSKKIARLVPDVGAFAVIMMRARKEVVNSDTFYWYDEEPAAWWTQINNAAGYTTTDTTLVVDDATIFKPKDLIKVPRTGEVMFVSAVPSSTSITVVRGYGTTAAAALVDNDWLMQLGNAMEENSSVPEARISQPVKQFNYVQEVRTPFDGSLIAQAHALQTSETERDRLTKDKLFEHRLMIERIMLAGERKEDVTNKRKTTGGILSFITTNVYSIPKASFTEAEFEKYCEMLFKYGSSRKLLVACSSIISSINQFSQGKLKTEVGDDTYGVRLTRYISAHGDLYIVKSNTLEKGYDGYALGLDMDNISYRPFVGMDTKLSRNIQPPDLHGWKDEYWTVFGVQVRLEKTHAVLRLT